MSHKRPWLADLDSPVWGTTLSSSPDMHLLFATLEDSDREIQVRVSREQARIVGEALVQWANSP